jgi:hypothetical protein
MPKGTLEWFNAGGCIVRMTPERVGLWSRAR